MFQLILGKKQCTDQKEYQAQAYGKGPTKQKKLSLDHLNIHQEVTDLEIMVTK